MSGDRTVSEWNLVREQFHALVRENSDNIEDILDVEFRRRVSELVNLAAKSDQRTERDT
jgi:hypothetical protein